MRIIVCLFLGFIIHSSAHAQWVQSGGPNGGNTNEIIQMGSELIVSVGNGGIYKSFDQGNTWKLSISGLPCNPRINALKKQNNVIYASVDSNGVYFSNDNGNNWQPLNKGIENMTFYSLFIDGSHLYAGSASGHIYHSSDGGLNWANKSNGILIDPYVAYAITDFIIYNSKIYGAGKFLYESSDHGDTWVKIGIPNLNSNGASALMVHNNIFYASSDGVVHASSDGLISWEDQSITNNDATITALFSFNNVLYGTTSLGRYFYTIDNGTQWTAIENAQTQSSVNHLFFMNSAIFMSTVEGLFKSSDNGLTWTASNKGLNALHITSLGKNNSFIFAGTTQNGIFRSEDNGVTWKSINNGINNLNSLTINEIVTNGNTIVIATEDGIFNSADNGSSWIKKFNPGLNKSTQALDYGNGVFVTAVNGSGVYKSVDNGETWQLAGTTGLDTDTSFYSVKTSGNIIVVSTHGGEMYISKNSGNSWQNISIASGFHLTHAFEFKNNKLYAATTKGLMVSSDFGQQWIPFNNDPKSINDILFDGDKIYIATDLGNYIATENEKVWHPLCEGMGKQFTNKLLVNKNMLLAGTHNSSVWIRPKVDGSLPPSENSDVGLTKLSLCATSGSVNLYHEAGIPLNTKGVWSPNLSGANGVFDPLIDPAGIYTFKFASDNCGCESDLRIEVHLDAQANAGKDTSLTLCKDTTSINLLDRLNGNPEPGGTWSPQLASGSDRFDPLEDAEGVYTYTISTKDCGTASSVVTIKLLRQPNAGINAQFSICENDAEIDLLNKLGGNPDPGGVWSPALFSNTHIFDPSIDKLGIYTYTVANGNCTSTSELFITLNIELNAGIDGTLAICIESNAVNLIDYLKGNPNPNGTWFPVLQDGLDIFNPLKDPPGIYTYTTSSACGNHSSKVSVTILEKATTADYDIEVKEFSNSNAIRVNIHNGSAYEYSLNGIDFQTDPIFDHLKGGKYTVYGQEIKGCGFFQKEVFVLDYPKYFTPNNDPWNNVWGISGVSDQNFKVYIFNRYGKLLKTLETISDTWDGNYKGNPMPTSDYWFKIVSDKEIVKTGHFTLKR